MRKLVNFSYVVEEMKIIYRRNESAGVEIVQSERTR